MKPLSLSFVILLFSASVAGQFEPCAYDRRSIAPGSLEGSADVIVLDDCDAMGGWTSNNTLSIDAQEKREGSACLSSAGGEGRRFSKVFATPVNTYCDNDSYFDLWLYISDVSAFNGGGQIEITSSGKSDVDEYNWSVNSLNLSNGWNELHLPIKDASVMGSPDLTAINFFRFYQFVSSEIVTKIDYLHFSGLGTISIAAPVIVSGVGGNETVFLNWADNSEPTLAGYHVYRSTTPGTGYARINEDPVQLSEYTDNDVSNGTVYYYVITSLNTEGAESQRSAEIAVQPLNTGAPDAPVNLTGEAGNGYVILDWDDNTDENLVGYNVYISLQSGSGYILLNSEPITESGYTDSLVINSVTYYYIVKAVNEDNNESAPSNEIGVTPKSTSTGLNKAEQGIRIYPNPAEDVLSLDIQLHEASVVRIAMSDLAGRAVGHVSRDFNLKSGKEMLSIPLENIQPGTYILNVWIGRILFTEKVMIR